MSVNDDAPSGQPDDGARARAWQPIETAPRDGTAIQARIPGHGSDNVIAWTHNLVGLCDEEDGGWSFVEDQEPPHDWTDGVCWGLNEDGVPSTQPTAWKPLPAPVSSGEGGA